MKKGFTLLELLIVIIIIGLLAAIGLVQYNRAVANAKHATAKSMLAEMRKVAQTYQAVNDAWPTALPIEVTLPGGDDSLSFTTEQDANYDYSIAGDDGVAGPRSGVAGTSALSTWNIDFATGAISTTTGT